MPRYEDRPVTREWIICENCGNDEIEFELNETQRKMFDKKCDVCGKDGCPECLEHDTFWHKKKEYYRHKNCKWTKKLRELKRRYEYNIELSCLQAACNYEPDHIC